MDYEALRGGLSTAIPFNSHIGLEVAEVAPGRAVVVLPDDSRLRNHIGSQHAAALFAAGEAASGGAFVGTFADRLSELTPLAEAAEIDFRRIARGPIRAVARVGESRERLLGTLERERRVRFMVTVELLDGDEDLVAEMRVRWHVRRRDAEP